MHKIIVPALKVVKIILRQLNGNVSQIVFKFNLLRNKFDSNLILKIGIMNKSNSGLLCYAFSIVILLGYSNFLYSQEVEINPLVAQRIAPGLYIHPAYGSYTTIFSGDDGLLLIDTGMEFEGAKSDSLIRTAFKKPVKYIIYSHSHLDHVGGSKSFAHDGTIIIAHKNARKEMLQSWKPPEIFKFTKIQPYSKKSLPDICFSDSLEIHFNNETIKLIHIPDAHTTGDIFVLFQKANAIHTGDVFITLNGFPPFECSFKSVIKGLDQLIQLCDEKTLVIPGHGPVSNRKGVIHFKEVLLTAADRINKLKTQGKTYDQIVALDPLAGLMTGKKYLSDNMFIYSVYYGNWGITR